MAQCGRQTTQASQRFADAVILWCTATNGQVACYGSDLGSRLCATSESPAQSSPDMMERLQHIKHVCHGQLLYPGCVNSQIPAWMVEFQTEVVHVCAMAAHRNKGQAAVQALTRMEPPSVKSKLMTDDEKICSSGLYVTNWACDSLHSHNRTSLAICRHLRGHAAQCSTLFQRACKAET